MAGTPHRTKQASESVSSQRIAGILREEILAGDPAPGQWLRQDDVAARLNVSRLPVREALRILASEGLVETIPNRGARVPVLDRAQVSTYYQMRERLDPLTLIESLTAISDEQIDRMEQLAQELEDCTDINRYLVLDQEFHMTSYEACPVAQLHAVTVRMWNSTQHYRRAFVRLAGPERLAIVNAEHRLIIDAVRRRDPVDAERFLAGHLRRTRIELTANDELFAT